MIKNYIPDSEIMFRAKKAVELQLEKQKIMGGWSAMYDDKTKTIYKLYPDGKKEVIKTGVSGVYEK